MNIHRIEPEDDLIDSEMRVYVVTEGEDYHYHVIGVFVGPKEIDVEAAADEYLRQNPKGSKHYVTEWRRFLPFIVEKLGLRPLEYTEVEIGLARSPESHDLSHFDAEFWRKKRPGWC